MLKWRRYPPERINIMDKNMKDFFDKVMNKNREPESDNDDIQGPESADGDNLEYGWNQDNFEEGLCPFCGLPDFGPEKMEEPDVAQVIFRCKQCQDGWVIIYFDGKPILFMPEYTFNKLFV